MKEILRHLPYYVLIGLMLFLFFDKCESDVNPLKDRNTVKIDTVQTVRTIKGDTIRDIQINPTPVTVINNNKEMLDLIKGLKNDQERIKHLLEELQIRVYDSTYVFKQGKLKIKDSVQGRLLSRDWSVFLDDIEYTENTITKTVNRYPKYAINAGLTTGLSSDFSSLNTVQNPFLGATIGLRNGQGYEFNISYNTLKTLEFRLKKDIFVKYKK